METQRASLSLGRWSLWLLLLGLALPSASAQALSYREAVLRAVDQLNERSSEANLYRLLEPSPPSLGHTVEDPGARKPVSFRVKETVCPRPSLQPPEQCDFKENGLVKQCLGTVSLDWSDDQFDINCNEASGPFCVGHMLTGSPALALHPLEKWLSNGVRTQELTGRQILSPTETPESDFGVGPGICAFTKPPGGSDSAEIVAA
nr:PREDICTED: cathelicidin-4-like [Bos indicus]